MSNPHTAKEFGVLAMKMHNGEQLQFQETSGSWKDTRFLNTQYKFRIKPKAAREFWMIQHVETGRTLGPWESETKAWNGILGVYADWDVFKVKEIENDD